MRIIPLQLWDHLPANNRDGFAIRSKNPVLAKVIEERRRRLSLTQDGDSYVMHRFALDSRVIVVEGISGSGKDSFQDYLKKKLKDRDVYDYSEGEVLTSWKQLQIEGVFELRIKFMKLFAIHIKDMISRDENAVFLLNRFHLSAYAQQPKVGSEYGEIIDILRTLPIHIFILQLDKDEIDKRCLHPERSGAWRKFQQQIVGNYSFRDRLENQQRVILELAERQQIPYSVIKLSDEPEIRDGQVRISESRSVIRTGGRMKAAGEKMSRRKRGVLQTVKEIV